MNAYHHEAEFALDAPDTQPGVRLDTRAARERRHRHLFADQALANVTCWVAFVTSLAVLAWIFWS